MQSLSDFWIGTVLGLAVGIVIGVILMFDTYEVKQKEAEV